MKRLDDYIRINIRYIIGDDIIMVAARLNDDLMPDFKSKIMILSNVDREIEDQPL